MTKLKTLEEMLAEDTRIHPAKRLTIGIWFDSHNIADCVPLEVETMFVKDGGFGFAEVLVVGKIEDTRAEVGGSYIEGYIELGDLDHTRVPLTKGRTVALLTKPKTGKSSEIDGNG